MALKYEKAWFIDFKQVTTDLTKQIVSENLILQREKAIHDFKKEELENNQTKELSVAREYARMSIVNGWYRSYGPFNIS